MSRPPGVITVRIPLPMRAGADATRMARPIAEEAFMRTADEISRKFRGGTLFVFRNDAPMGFCWDKGVVHRDVLTLLEVDVPDTRESRRWLRSYARRVLLRRFRQKAMTMKFVGPVETPIVSHRDVKE